MKIILKALTSLWLAALLALVPAGRALAFCGFYAAGANAQLFNKASQVILAHQGDRTTITMANDFQGDVKNFALVVPVPVPISREQVQVSDRAILKKLDNFSQPRLVEYRDENPCQPVNRYDIQEKTSAAAPMASAAAPASSDAKKLGVTVVDQFKVNEYEIMILAAKESDGLETWLAQNGYSLPHGASAVLQPYIRQKMKFFVAKVDLKEFEKSSDGFLRPLQISYQSPKFMLPIRLGMLNAQGDQDLVAYLLSPKGQVQVTNYRTVKVPTGNEIPESVKNDFGKFYKAAFQKSYEQEDKKVAFLEYAWDVGNCDPCSTTPPTNEELVKAGAFWVKTNRQNKFAPAPWSMNSGTFITRLHVRYSRDKFAEDLVFQETSNRENFQGRYVINYPYRGTMTCSAAKDYQKKVTDRQSQEANNLVQLTGWNLSEIQKDIKPIQIAVAEDDNRFWIWKLLASLWKGLFG
jgi:hypothetical protein